MHIDVDMACIVYCVSQHIILSIQDVETLRGFCADAKTPNKLKRLLEMVLAYGNPLAIAIITTTIAAIATTIATIAAIATTIAAIAIALSLSLHAVR